MTGTGSCGDFAFSRTQPGARASADLYSLIKTAKGHGLCPCVYLRHVFKQLPLAEKIDDMDVLLPGSGKGGVTDRAVVFTLGSGPGDL